jgi:hypothetical protein
MNAAAHAKGAFQFLAAHHRLGSRRSPRLAPPMRVLAPPGLRAGRRSRYSESRLAVLTGYHDSGLVGAWQVAYREAGLEPPIICTPEELVAEK